jgi:hypothetical protein
MGTNATGLQGLHSVPDGISQPVGCVISRTFHANPTRGVSHRSAPPKRSHEPTAPKSPPIRCVKSRTLRVVRNIACNSPPIPSQPDLPMHG